MGEVMYKRCNNIERNYTIEDLEELLDNIPYEVYLKSKDGKYKYINAAAADSVGKDKKDIIGKDDLQLRSPKMAKICVDSDKKVLKNGQ